ncbi:hypothetical protein K2173_018367 [Erythroxylum novogranatense]|uniref:DUF4378 domain-containing protein n=1 Tax=Erythroxylum novogranatense TaxID=1862640 RepID=A0AAV8UE62_9ROSI|nr:hypothetical protein K2173_018367 [Erythroxylum novogranatense]
MTKIVQEQNLEKQMGCMAGFLQIFDRPNVLTGKRLYATKRLPPSLLVDSTPDPDTCMSSLAELEKHQPSRSMPSPDRFKQSPVTELLSPALEAAAPVDVHSKMPLPLQIFELKEGTKSSRKFGKEAPRLSLDSRATFDAAKGGLKPKESRQNPAFMSANRCENNGEDSDKQRRSPSVIARLMGLEKLPESESEESKKPELRRSASESRASRDLLQYRFIDGINFQLKQPHQQSTESDNMNREGVIKDPMANARTGDPKAYNAVRNVRAEPARAQNRGIGQRKNFFDSADFFPEPKQAVSAYVEIEKRLRMRGIDEPSKDLETLKQILEAVQLKGLLHSKKAPNQFCNRNFVYDRSLSRDESPIVVMKPARSMSPMNRRIGNDSPPSSFRTRAGVRRDSYPSGETPPTMSPRREGLEIERNVRNQPRTTIPVDIRLRCSNRRPLTVETQRRVSNESMEQRRGSPVQSPKISSRRNVIDQSTNRSPRNRKQSVGNAQKEEKVFIHAEDESSTFSECSISTSSQTDTEFNRSKADDYKEGRNLLERCDKLLHSIAEMTATELQPSPVSVLDSSFYKEESSPSPVMKRSIDFKDQLFADIEDDIWSPAISPMQCKSKENSSDCDYIYISDILRASVYLPEDSEVFLLLEKQQYDTSKVSTLQRKLTFDTITEILDRKKQLPPWKTGSWVNFSCGPISLQEIWSEFQRIRERDSSDDLFEVICGVLKKDLAAAGDAVNGWGDCPIEMSEAVLDIERLIFKDLISETIRDLAAFSGKWNQMQITVPRRKLVF